MAGCYLIEPVFRGQINDTWMLEEAGYQCKTTSFICLISSDVQPRRKHKLSAFTQYPSLAPSQFSHIEESNIKRSVIRGPVVVRLMGGEAQKTSFKSAEELLCFLKPFIFLPCIYKADVYNKKNKDLL